MKEEEKAVNELVDAFHKDKSLVMVLEQILKNVYLQDDKAVVVWRDGMNIGLKVVDTKKLLKSEVMKDE